MGVVAVGEKHSLALQCWRHAPIPLLGPFPLSTAEAVSPSAEALRSPRFSDSGYSVGDRLVYPARLPFTSAFTCELWAHTAAHSQRLSLLMREHTLLSLLTVSPCKHRTLLQATSKGLLLHKSGNEEACWSMMFCPLMQDEQEGSTTALSEAGESASPTSAAARSVCSPGSCTACTHGTMCLYAGRNSCLGCVSCLCGGCRRACPLPPLPPGVLPCSHASLVQRQHDR